MRFVDRVLQLWRERGLGWLPTAACDASYKSGPDEQEYDTYAWNR